MLTDTQIINISLPTRLLELADRVAENEARSRSELFREAIRSYLLKRKLWTGLFSYAGKQVKKYKVNEGEIEKIIDSYRTGKK